MREGTGADVTVRATPLPDGRTRLSATSADGAFRLNALGFPDGHVSVDSGKPAVVFENGRSFGWNASAWLFAYFGVPFLLILFLSPGGIVPRAHRALAIDIVYAIGAVLLAASTWSLTRSLLDRKETVEKGGRRYPAWRLALGLVLNAFWLALAVQHFYG